MKISIIVCIVASCTMCGHALAGTSERRKKLLRDLITALKRLRIELGSCSPLQSALLHTDIALFTSMAAILPEEQCISDAWRTVRSRECSRGKRADALSERDLFALDGLFDHLGTSGRGDQIESLQSCISILEESLLEAREHSSQIGRLYTSLGFLFGLSLAILLI